MEKQDILPTIITAIIFATVFNFVNVILGAAWWIIRFVVSVKASSGA